LVYDAKVLKFYFLCPFWAHRVKYKLILSYKGSRYHGWQIQENAHSVQAEIENALKIIAGEKIGIVGCGRTDTGVHAKFYVAHFETEVEFKSNVVYTLNAILPEDIAILDLKKVGDDFHARFSAISREYQYFIHFHKNPFLTGNSWYVNKQLNIELMNKASEILSEYQDFASFCKLGADNKTTICEIQQASWQISDNQLVFTIRADRFLRNMVRAIVGTLMEIGLERMSLIEFRAVIESKNRQNSGTSVPAHALYLTDVKY
jgi:tRNA pseudouridine38-40 synthase